MVEKRRVGGLMLGRYMHEGRGAGWARYCGSRTDGGGGRAVYVCERIDVLFTWYNVNLVFLGMCSGAEHVV